VCVANVSASQEDEESDTPVQAALELTIFPPFKGTDSKIPGAIGTGWV
jgi:hypothetical protein